MPIFLGSQIEKPIYERDFEAGRRDRMAGYYDKWYRYNRVDDGAAYDAGVVSAINAGKAPADVTIIPCR